MPAGEGRESCGRRELGATGHLEWPPATEGAGTSRRRGRGGVTLEQVEVVTVPGCGTEGGVRGSGSWAQRRREPQWLGESFKSRGWMRVPGDPLKCRINPA